MRLIVITGMPGSGKEELLNVAASMNIPFVRMGDVVREHYGRSDKSLSVGEFAGKEREIYGPDVWAKRCVEGASGTVFLIDGCRSRDEVISFKGITEDVITIAIHTSRKTRFERLVARGRNDAPMDMKEFDERDKREIKWGISETIVLSDVMMINESTLEDFHEKCVAVLEGMR